MECLEFSLMITGLASVLVMVLMCGVLLCEFVADTLRTLKWRYKYKHRFDKPPTAQCYCKDCRYYTSYDLGGRCGRGHIEQWSVADNYFCWQAEPLKRDPELKKNKDN